MTLDFNKKMFLIIHLLCKGCVLLKCVQKRIVFFSPLPVYRPSVRPSVCPSVSPSVHKTGSRDNLKSTENIFMKLGIWIDGSMEIMHVFFFFSYVENFGCYGNK
jgi:hypothetical protein